MALTWDASKVEGWKEKGGALADMIIWNCMFVGIPRITEENAVEFATRVSFMERLHEASLMYDKKPRYITLEDVREYIGIETNASTLTRAQFIKRQADRFFREAEKLEAVPAAA